MTDIVLTVRAAIRAYCQERDLIDQNEQLRQINADLESMVARREPWSCRRRTANWKYSRPPTG